VLITIIMMIVLVDDDDDDGVVHSHAIIKHQLGMLSLSLSISCNHIQTTKSNMSSSLPNTKASSGVLDPCHRLSSLAHASTCREQASEPAIINSST